MELSKPYFPLRNDLNYGESLLLGKYGVKGYGIYILLLQEINRSYYLRFNEDIGSMLARKWGASTGLVFEIVRLAVSINLFDSDMFQKYGILTNAEIQENHFLAIKGRGHIELDKTLLITSVIPKLKKYAVYRAFFEENEQDLNREKETKQNKTKQNENNDNSDSLIIQQFKNFKNQYPNKCLNIEVDEIPASVNLGLLFEKIQESEFLQKCNNLDLKWCMKPKNYEKIVNDYFKAKDFSSVVTIQHNYPMREYSQEQIQELFTDLDSVQI